MLETKKDIVNRLQKQILQWQGFIQPSANTLSSIGLGALETAFPNSVFTVAAIHEMLCPTPEHTAATSGFMGGLLNSLMRQGGVCLWIGISRKLFPLSLTTFEVIPDRVIFIDLKNERDVLWLNTLFTQT